MFKFATEKKRKQADQDFDLLTPVKTAKRPNLSKENAKAEQSDSPSETPFTKRVKQNITMAYAMSEDIIGRIDEFEKQLEQTRFKIEEEKLDLDNILETPSVKNKKDNLINFEFSEVKFESAQKVHKQSVYFSGIQTLKNLAKRIFDFEHFSSSQLKIFQKMLLGDKILHSGSHVTGKSTTYTLFLKMLFDQNADTYKNSVIILTSQKKMNKVSSCLKSANLINLIKLATFTDFFCEQEDLRYNQDQTSKDDCFKPKILIVDSINFSIEKLLKLKKFGETLADKINLYVFGFYQPTEINLISDILRFSKSNIVLNQNMAPIAKLEKRPKISISYDEDFVKASLKYIRDILDEERSKKVKMHFANFSNFCILTKDKTAKDKIIEFCGNYAFKVCVGNKLGQDTDVALVESLSEIHFSYKHLFVVDFDFEVSSYTELVANFDKSIHVYLNPKKFQLRRNEEIRKLVSAFSFWEIISELETSNHNKSFTIDQGDKKHEACNIQNFIVYLQQQNMLDIENIECKKRVTIFVKNSNEFKTRIQSLPKAFDLIDQQISKSEITVFLPSNAADELEAVLLPLKKDGAIALQLFGAKVVTVKSNYRKTIKMKDQFDKIVCEYNELVCCEIRKIDSLFCLLKKHGFAHLTRTKRTDQSVLDKIRSDCEKLVFKNEFFDDEEMLPFRANFKRHDIIRNLSVVVKDNLKMVNSVYFSRTEIKNTCVFETILFDILKQVFLDAKLGFTIDDSIHQKLRSLNTVKLVEMFKTSVDILRKELLI